MRFEVLVSLIIGILSEPRVGPVLSDGKVSPKEPHDQTLFDKNIEKTEGRPAAGGGPRLPVVKIREINFRI